MSLVSADEHSGSFQHFATAVRAISLVPASFCVDVKVWIRPIPSRGMAGSQVCAFLSLTAIAEWLGRGAVQNCTPRAVRERPWRPPASLCSAVTHMGFGQSKELHALLPFCRRLELNSPNFSPGASPLSSQAFPVWGVSPPSLPPHTLLGPFRWLRAFLCPRTPPEPASSHSMSQPHRPCHVSPRHPQHPLHHLLASSLPLILHAVARRIFPSHVSYIPSAQTCLETLKCFSFIAGMYPN